MIYIKSIIELAEEGLLVIFHACTFLTGSESIRQGEIDYGCLKRVDISFTILLSAPTISHVLLHEAPFFLALYVSFVPILAIFISSVLSQELRQKKTETRTPLRWNMHNKKYGAPWLATLIVRPATRLYIGDLEHATIGSFTL